ncbi:MAG: Fe-S cluster assembly protein SufD [Sphingomonadales bacterium]|nr:Fe-S cluster assembly protein SufD [Sphingomonadales bacterium]
MSLLDFPSAKSEGWRWSDLSALPALAEAAQGAFDLQRLQLPWLDCSGPRLLFVNGSLNAPHSELGPLSIGPVATEASAHPLGRLVGREGWTLRLGPDGSAPGLIQIVHVSTGGADHLPAAIALAEDAQASIVETFVGEGWANRLTRIALGPHARLMLARRILSTGGFVSLTDRAALGEGASLVVTALAAGGSDTRFDGEIILNGEGGYAEAGGALLATDRGRHDANFVVRHAAPGGTSRQVWRSVADGRATCSVAARVEVARDAQKTDGEQSLKGLLLSRAATINAKPELEIFADDVKCAHGATVGALDQGALFYLASRGVPEAEAKALLTNAFVADAIDRIGEPQVRDAFGKDATSWLDGASPLAQAGEGL